jgi:hypothetical protein
MTARQRHAEQIRKLHDIIRELAGRVRVQNLKDELLVARAKSAVRNGSSASPETFGPSSGRGPHHLLVVGKTGAGKSRLGEGK